MRNISLMLVLVFAMSAIGAVAQEKTSTSERVTIINGKFFSNMKETLAKVKVTAGMQIFMISTPNGSKAAGIKLAAPLSEDVLRDTIPMAQVPEGAELLRRFEEAQQRMGGMTLSEDKRGPLIKAGDKFPEFSATDIDGKTWSSADVKGKVMVLNLWFTGCGPCRAEMPELSTWKNEMPEVMFFSSTYETAEIARPVIEARQFNWIPLINDTLFHKYIGDNGYPLTIVVDKEGVVAMAEYGASDAKRKALKEKIKSLR